MTEHCSHVLVVVRHLAGGVRALATAGSDGWSTSSSAIGLVHVVAAGLDLAVAGRYLRVGLLAQPPRLIDRRSASGWIGLIVDTLSIYR